MFSESYNSEIQEYFHRQMALLNDRREELRQKETGLPDADGRLPHLCRELLEQKIEEIEDTLKRCTKDEAEALQFLYSAMPLSDMLDYPAAVYLSFARHGVEAFVVLSVMAYVASFPLAGRTLCGQGSREDFCQLCTAL